MTDKDIFLSEIKFKKKLLIFGIILSSITLFFLGVFTVICVVWARISHLKLFEYSLIFACLFVLFLLILCARYFSKLETLQKNILNGTVSIEDKQKGNQKDLLYVYKILIIILIGLIIYLTKS